MNEKRKIIIPALMVRQPIGEFYIGVMDHKTLEEISFADVRTMANDLDKYLGIQRKLSQSRVKEIKGYVKSIDASFPTSIVLAVDEECATWNDENNSLTLFETDNTPFEQLAKILDGQHRIEGLKGYEGDIFDLNVTIFVGADIADQAYVFATVNLAQTKVNKSLVYDLYDYSHSRSPQKTAHDIVVAIDGIKDSPFFGMIKRLGFATPGRDKETLTQAAIVEILMKYFLSENPLHDRDILLKGKTPSRAAAQELKKHPFRNLFIDGNDVRIIEIIIEYFKAVETKWPTAWRNRKERGNILPKTNGVRALFRFLRDSYIHIVPPKDIGALVTKETFSEVLSKINISDDEFTIDNFPPGTSGESSLYSRLLKDTQIKNDQYTLQL